MARTPFQLVLVVAILSLPTAAPAVTVDAFTDAFPANECLPNSGLPILFVGPYCDGASCPPDPVAPCWENSTQQSGLAGVLSGHAVPAARGVFVSTLNETPASARIRPELGRLEIEVGQDAYHGVQVSYSSGTSEDLGLNLPALGAAGLAFELFGDPAPTHPISISVNLITSHPVPGGQVFDTANYAGTLDHTGPWLLPFSAFQTSSGFSYAEVDLIVIELTGDVGAPGSPLPARSWAIGPITFMTGPTASATRTWGGLKALYR